MTVMSGAERMALWGIDWPGHPDCKVSGPVEESLRDEPTRWRLLRVETDPEADYDYDDLALMVRDDGLHALVRTSGCSCPSPTETWGVIESGSLADMLAACEREAAEWGGDLPSRGPWRGMREWLVQAVRA